MGLQRTQTAGNERSRILTVEPAALPSDLAARTDVLPLLKERWWERAFSRLGLKRLASRSQAVRRSLALFRSAPAYAAVITVGDFSGLLFAWMQALRRRARPVNIMYDCLWYGGNKLKRRWMRSCLKQVDRCVVWASVERQRYARAYGLPVEKFVHVLHHHTLHNYTYEVGDKDYVFTGGNADRDYGPFFAAVEELPVRAILATNRPETLHGYRVPANVRVVSVSPAEFRRLMGRASLIVMPMRATLLHAGAQQTILNAMLMEKPVILTDPEGGADYIEHGKTGLLVPYKDVAGLRDAIRNLMANRERATEMGRRARTAVAALTTERSNTVIWGHVLELVGERRPVPLVNLEPVPAQNAQCNAL